MFLYLLTIIFFPTIVNSKFYRLFNENNKSITLTNNTNETYTCIDSINCTEGHSHCSSDNSTCECDKEWKSSNSTKCDIKSDYSTQKKIILYLAIFFSILILIGLILNISICIEMNNNRRIPDNTGILGFICVVILYFIGCIGFVISIIIYKTAF